eukprot:203812-Chlamydomonas_euryale.AAC.8
MSGRACLCDQHRVDLMGMYWGDHFLNSKWHVRQRITSQSTIILHRHRSKGPKYGVKISIPRNAVTHIFTVKAASVYSGNVEEDVYALRIVHTIASHAQSYSYGCYTMRQSRLLTASPFHGKRGSTKGSSKP